MAGHLSVHNLNVRPGLTRSRSSTSPNTVLKVDNPQADLRPTRPTHVRSRSYVSPTNPKPTNTATFPASTSQKSAEPSRLSRLYLPGRSQEKSGTNDSARPQPRRHQSGHRYTQSEAQQYHRHLNSAVSNDSPLTPGYVASSASSVEGPRDYLYPGSRGAAIPQLTRITSSRSYRNAPSGDAALYHTGTMDLRPGLRRRATSDPRSPTQEERHTQLQPAVRSPIAIELERAEYLRRIALDNVTEEEVKDMQQQLRDGAQELQDRLMGTTRSMTGLRFRLDEAEDSLFRTTETIVDAIFTFKNLTDQSLKLIENFEHESSNLDAGTRKRIAHFRHSIDGKRGKKLEKLEKRGQSMSTKAEELGRRLQNCRTIVENWQEREINKRRAWRGVWVGLLWGVALISIAILAGIASWKAIEISGGHGTADQRLRHMTVDNKSYDAGVVKSLEVPEDVKEVLMDINDRAQEGRNLEMPPADQVQDEKSTTKDDSSFRLLDEL